MNSAIDASGVKDAVSDALLAHTWDIANATGISSSQVQTCIENLDIKDWQVDDLPANAVPANTVSGSAAGVPATLTTYNAPLDHVTVKRLRPKHRPCRPGRRTAIPPAYRLREPVDAA